MTDDVARNADHIATLEHLISLLDRASREIWHAADEAGAHSPLYWLGLGVFLAQAQAVELLPNGHMIADAEPVVDLALVDKVDTETTARRGHCVQQSAAQLLRAAEQLTGSSSLHDAGLPGLSALVVELCGLIREAGNAGC